MLPSRGYNAGNIRLLSCAVDISALRTAPSSDGIRESVGRIQRIGWAVEFEDLADDSLLTPGNHVATVGLLFNPASRLILPEIDTGRVLSHMGNVLHYSGKGIQGMSGSPVWMMTGGRPKLVGIHSYHRQEYESYAIKASVIKSHMK